MANRTTDSSSNTAVVAIVVLVLIAIIAFFLFLRPGTNTGQPGDTDINIQVDPPRNGGGGGSPGN
jgi:hypothetical protein